MAAKNENTTKMIDELHRLYELDEKRFRQHYAANPNLANQNQLAAHMIFSAHSLEKSLSNDNFEVGHGFRVARKLIEFLNIYRNKGFDKYHLAYINTLSVLKAFYERHKDTKFEKEIEVIFGEWANDIKTCKSNIGGADVIPLSQKKNNDKKNFKELASGRFSVRTYSDDPVSRDDIKEAIEIAMKTPTVCNRQSIKVRAIYKKEIIEKVLEIQGGLAYYDTPPVLLLITADDNGYVGPNERNQGFIDGGLFAMSVLYALEYKKLAACPAHAMLPEILEKKIRGMLNISDSEKLITFITVGHFKEKNNIPKSFRYPTEYVLLEVGQLYDYEIVEVADEKASEHKNKDAAAEIPSVKTIAKDIIFLIKHKTRVRTRARKLVALFGRYLDSLAYRQADGAILTLTGYFNYGNVLQRYALQKFLRDHGKKFVSYTDPYSAPRSIYKIGRKIKLKTPFRAIKRFIKRQRPYWYIPTYSDLYPEAKGLINVINFVNKNIWIKPFDPRDKYGCYIVGSDQVWRNWWGSKETLGYYFFNFLKDRKVKRIAYAASFGKDNIEEIMSPEDVEYVRPYIKSIDRISVREKSGIDIIKRTWSIENVVETVDPTLLLTSADYSRLIDNSGTKNEKIQPIFAYVLDETDKISDFIQKIQNKKQQAVTKIRAHSKADKTLPPVELWLKGFRDAELVVTNSFHGMVFSVINNTDFIVVGRESGGLSRIKDFLKEYDITGRFVEEDSLDNFDVEKLESIDWSAVNRKLEHNRKMSRDWLLQSLT